MHYLFLPQIKQLLFIVISQAQNLIEVLALHVLLSFTCFCFINRLPQVIYLVIELLSLNMLPTFREDLCYFLPVFLSNDKPFQVVICSNHEVAPFVVDYLEAPNDCLLLLEDVPLFFVELVSDEHTSVLDEVDAEELVKLVVQNLSFLVGDWLQVSEYVQDHILVAFVAPVVEGRLVGR